MNMGGILPRLVAMLGLLITATTSARAAQILYFYDFVGPEGPSQELTFSTLDFNSGNLSFITGSASSAAISGNDFSFSFVTFGNGNSYDGADFIFPSLPSLTTAGTYPINTLVLSTTDLSTGTINRTTEDGGTLTITALTIGDPEPVPEPASPGVYGIGLVGLAAALRRRRGPPQGATAKQERHFAV